MQTLIDPTKLNHKVIIFVKHKVGIVDQLMAYFSDPQIMALTRTRPLELTGDVDEKKRLEIKRTFNAYNGDFRLLIATLATGGESISLHDTSGTAGRGLFPRHALISPTFSAIEQIQAAGRIDRTGVTSIPYVDFVFAAIPYPEARVLKALTRRYDVLRGHISARSNAKPLTLPDEYPAIVDGVGEFKTLQEAITALAKTLTAEDQQLLAGLGAKSTKKVTTLSTGSSGRGRGAGAAVNIPSVMIPTFNVPVVVSSAFATPASTLPRVPVAPLPAPAAVAATCTPRRVTFGPSVAAPPSPEWSVPGYAYESQSPPGVFDLSRLSVALPGEGKGASARADLPVTAASYSSDVAPRGASGPVAWTGGDTSYGEVITSSRNGSPRFDNM